MNAKTKTKEYLTKLANHLNKYNKMSPFPIYDTEYVSKVEEEIEKLEKTENINYDTLPVHACVWCSSLHVTIEEEDGVQYDLCNRCFNTDGITEFKNIHEYQNFLKDNGYGKDS